MQTSDMIKSLCHVKNVSISELARQLGRLHKVLIKNLSAKQ